ncbi:MAG TPA: M48 family metalloprotease, partial [Micavibrio sp.]
FEITQKLSAKIGIPTPAVYLSSIFSIYKDKTLTVRMLACKDELSGAISHEIAHAKNKDHWHRQMQKLACKFNQHSLITQTLCAITYSLMTTDYASLKIFPFSIAAYGAAYLLSSYHGRQEEFEADKGSAQLLGSGIPLAKYLWRVSLIEDNPAGVHKIYNRLTATHPPSDIRIKELIEKEGGWGEHRPRPPTAI